MSAVVHTAGPVAAAAARLSARARWHPLEAAFWLAALASVFLLPGRHLLLTEIAILGLDPTFPLKYMIYFLIVVTVGGTTSISGPFLASLLLGIGDVAGKYYVPTLGAFVIYTIMIAVLIWRPQGLFARRVAK